MKLAIIGGGPVGLMTALYLEKQGHTVDVFEKGSWPRDKTCGQGIMPSGIKMLNDLDIKFIEGEECRPFKGITYHDGSLTLKGLLPRKGYGVERKVLSQKLIEKIKEKSNIHLYPNTTIIETSNNFETFKIKVNNEEKNYDYALLVMG